MQANDQTSSTGPPPTVAAALWDLLRVEGVDRIFGIPGGANIASLQALKDGGAPTLHICRHETGAAYIADGYARVSGGLGVVLTTSGPGATNAVTGVVNAHASGTPLFVLTGEVKEAVFGRGFLQEGADSGLNIVDIYRNAIGYSEMITSPANAVEFFQAAMRSARGGRTGAAHLSLPGDVAGAPMPAGYTAPTSPTSYRADSGYSDPAGIARAVELIAKSTRPLLMLGNACRGALQNTSLLDAFIAAVEHLALPVITGADGKGIFPESHPLSLRNVGVAECCWPSHYFDTPDGHFDTLVTIGSALGQLATNTWEATMVPSTTFVQIDDDPSMIGRDFPLTFGVISSAEAAIRDFVVAANNVRVPTKRASARRSLVRNIKNTLSPFVNAEIRNSDTDPIAPQAMMRIIGETLPSGSHILVDAGNCVGWCLHELVIDPPTQLHTAVIMGPMGFGVGAVIGAKLAAPDATCLSVVGDGAFLMHCAEISTAAQYDVGAIWVVLADHDLSMVSQGMAAVTGDSSFQDYYTVGWNDLAAVAQGLGAQAYDVSSAFEFTGALTAAIAAAEKGVPQVIAVSIDPSQMPPYRYPPPPPPPPPVAAKRTTRATPRRTK